jgi:hypothetical protein
VTLRGTLVLWSAAAALAAYLWLTQPPVDGPEPEPAGDTGPPLLDFRPADVTALVVAGAEDRLALRRDPSGWRDERDRPWPVPGLVDTVLETLAGIRTIASIEEAPTSLGDYGLDPPQRSITVTVRSGQPRGRRAGEGRAAGTAVSRGDGAAEGEATASRTLLIGDRNPAWTGVYARVPPADRVVLIGSVLPWELDKLVGAVRPADPEERRGGTP